MDPPRCAISDLEPDDPVLTREEPVAELGLIGCAPTTASVRCDVDGVDASADVTNDPAEHGDPAGSWRRLYGSKLVTGMLRIPSSVGRITRIAG